MSSVNPYSNEKEFPSFQNYNIENYNGHFIDIGSNEISNETNKDLFDSINESTNLVNQNDIEPTPLNTPSMVQTGTIPVSYDSTPVSVSYVPSDNNEQTVIEDDSYVPEPSVAEEQPDEKEATQKSDVDADEDADVDVSVSNTETNISNSETNIINEEEENNEINITNNYYNMFSRYKICPIRMTIIFLLIIIIGILFFLK